MTGLQRALALSAVGVVLLVALGAQPGNDCNTPFARGVAAGILWGVAVPLFEATIRGGWLTARPIFGYAILLALPPVASVAVFLLIPAYARGFAFASFPVWLFGTSILDLCCRNGTQRKSLPTAS